ncbi:MAG: hypothetical protein EA342_03515 [Leptolyngbya sp. LCM1.Bin17]|nr:MAG: hypothetical protein EA342_03515 [Leptolyngbya sp. LCM1.Bin17]
MTAGLDRFWPLVRGATALNPEAFRAIEDHGDVVSHHGSGIVVVKAHSLSGIDQRRVCVNKPQQMPASRLDWVTASAITRFELVG